MGTLYRHFPRRIDLVEAVYREDVDALVARADELEDGTPPCEALTRWLEAFVAYAAAERTFLTELHEAFGKSPDLAVSSRERTGRRPGACWRGLRRPGSCARTSTSGRSCSSSGGCACPRARRSRATSAC